MAIPIPLTESAGVFGNLYKTLESISVSQKIIYYEHSVFRSKEFPGYYYLVSNPVSEGFHFGHEDFAVYIYAL